MDTRLKVNEEHDIAIVGISVFCPAGGCVEEFWDGIARGGDFIIDAPPEIIEPYYFEGEPNGIDHFYCKRGGFSPIFKVDPLRYGILPITASGIEPDQLISMAGTEQALTDAGVFEKGIPLQKCSIIIGRGNFGGLISLRSIEVIREARQFTELLRSALPDLTDKDIEKVRRAYQARQGRYQADMAIGSMTSLVAAMVANRFDMHGPAYIIDAACASGILAIDHSIGLLRSGQCDIAVAGAMHVGQSAMFWSIFDMMGAMSRRQQIAPFSEDADGLLVGQGGGFVVLKTLRKALEDGDRVYAVIKETAVSSDGAGSHVLVTNVAGQVRVLKKAWDRSGMDPEKLGYIEAHGTATPVGDRTEIATLKEFFGDNSHAPALVGSIKSNIGHTMPAAGMLGIIKTALALYHRKIPPTLHCEQPLASMFESRFLPPQELIDWDGENYPLVAGVNAFGFGGVNSHAILTPYEPPAGMPPQPKPKPWLGEALMLSAPNKEALIEKLRTGDYTHTGGSYRLVLFDPDDDRVKKAIQIVDKDKPWHGRMDLWFSNASLLANGGKVAFLCAGFGTEEPGEADSISEMFDLPSLADLLRQEDDSEAMQAVFQYLYLSWLGKEALAKLGVKPDLYAGDSVGDWTAALFAGILEGRPSDIFRPMFSVNPEPRPLIAVVGIDTETAEAWCAEIPDLYLTNSNCPSQVLLTGTQAAVDILLERLRERQLFHTALPHGAGIHTPLLKLPEGAYTDYLDHVRIREGEVPVWSAATLTPVPADKDEYLDLLKSQLTRTSYFRELVDKLYDEQNVRVFVQLGVGSLVGFIRETLAGKSFSAIASSVAERNSADQLRRVLAAIFVEGRDVDPGFMGVKLMHRVEHRLRVMERGAPPIITELPELTEVIKARYGAAGPFATRDADIESSGNPLLTAARANMREATQAGNELVRLFEQTGWQSTTGLMGASAGAQAPATAAPGAGATTGATTPPATTGADLPPSFVEKLPLAFEDHPYLVDHSIIRQPKGWEFPEDLNLVVPLTMTIELLAEIAKRHAPGRKLIRAGKIMAYRWIALENSFEGDLEGTWKNPDLLELNLKGYAKAEFSFGDEWPEPPSEYQGEIDIGDRIMDNLPVEVLYERYSFHGPQYHSSTKMLKASKRGMISHAKKREGKGSLLDIMGQQLGLFLHLSQTENTVSFPVRLKELNFYADILDQEGAFEHTMIVTRLTDSNITADMVLKRDGKIWSVARDFVCQRFQSNIPVWHVILRPHTSKLAEEIAPSVYFYSNINEGNVLTLLFKRYFNTPDRAEAEKLGTQARIREHLGSRITLKDAVRDFARRRQGVGEMVYPIEIFISHDEKGKLLVRGHGRAKALLDGIQVSLSHKGDESVAIVANEPVGIDLERIEEKSDGFKEMAFTERERALLAELPQPQAPIQFWVAKEASAKKAGTGLEGNPRRFEVTAVDGDVLSVGDQKVQTARIGEEYVVGWTL